MENTVKHKPATVSFFNGIEGSSESEEEYAPSNYLREETDSANPFDNHRATQNPFEETVNTSSSFHEGANAFDNGRSSESDDDSFYGAKRDGVSSIYDSHSEVDDLACVTRERSDSQSNFMATESNEEELLVIMEDHYGVPEDLTMVKEIDRKIEKIKSSIYTTEEDDPNRQTLIDKLVSFQLRKSELLEQSNNQTDDNIKQIYGHKFSFLDDTGSDNCCEVCCQLVWGVLQSWFTCTYCSMCCHEKCVDSLKRMCARVRVLDSGTFSLLIRPDQGLMSQNYKCYECKAPISYKPGSLQPRQCDYSGNYYCPVCHWDDEMVIPARIVHNWDFGPRKVCRASKQYLRLMDKKPILNLEQLNPRLFNFVEELREMKKLRQEILTMKLYFLSCQQALKSKLLLLLKDRQHFRENSEFYSLTDLASLYQEKLIPKIVKVHASFSTHIKVDCDTCKGKGYICELCNRDEILFSFDNICATCESCGNVFHKYCYNNYKTCKRCERRKLRQQETERKKAFLLQIELSK